MIPTWNHLTFRQRNHQRKAGIRNAARANRSENNREVIVQGVRPAGHESLILVPTIVKPSVAKYSYSADTADPFHVDAENRALFFIIMGKPRTKMSSNIAWWSTVLVLQREDGSWNPSDRMERRNSSWGFEATSWFRLCDLSQYKEEFKRVCHRPQILFTWANFRALEVLLSLQLGLKKWCMVPKERIEDSVSCSLPIVTEVYFSALKTGSSNLPMLLWRRTRLKLWQVKTRVPMGMVLPRRWRLFLSSATVNKFRPTQSYKLRVGQWACLTCHKAFKKTL